MTFVAKPSLGDVSGARILDACCGSRMFWFDRQNPDALFIDNRRAIYPVDKGTVATKGRSPIVVNPDLIADFTALPFEDNRFHLVVFDPPHVQRDEIRGTLTRCYGILKGDWRGMLRQGFAECFRVLRPNGVLVFKWAETQFRVKDILALAPTEPLFGHKTSKTTYWAVFMKGATTQGTSASGQDPKGLEAKPAGPVHEVDAPNG